MVYCMSIRTSANPFCCASCTVVCLPLRPRHQLPLPGSAHQADKRHLLDPLTFGAGKTGLEEVEHVIWFHMTRGHLQFLLEAHAVGSCGLATPL